MVTESIMQRVAVTILLLCVITQAAELPSSFKICKQNDPNLPKCFAEAALQAIRVMASGVESLKLLPIDPLSLDSISMGKNTASINLQQQYRNIKLYGLSKDLEIFDYHVDLPNLIFKSVSFNPQVDFVADYSMQGKVLFMPIQGYGHCNITMLNLQTQHTFYGEKFMQNGEIYMRIKNYEVKLNPKDIRLDFQSRMTRNKSLSSFLTNFLKTNSKLLFNELRSSYEATFGQVFGQIANEILTRVPLNKILPAS